MTYEEIIKTNHDAKDEAPPFKVEIPEWPKTVTATTMDYGKAEFRIKVIPSVVIRGIKDDCYLTVAEAKKLGKHILAAAHRADGRKR